MKKEDDEASSLDSTVTNTPSNLPSGELSKIYEIELRIIITVYLTIIPHSVC